MKLFSNNDPDRCCLCGGPGAPTGEHKIKAAALLDELGEGSLYIGSYGGARSKIAQSHRSKHLKFKAFVCAPCNNARSSPADREFERFHGLVRSKVDRGDEPNDVFLESRYAVGSAEYLNVFRYFAKLLCCQMADANCPRPKPVAAFAIGRTNRNPVLLGIRTDWAYGEMKHVVPDFSYAAHGGLVIFGERASETPGEFYSTLTLGPVQYFFFVQLTWRGKLELRLFHPAFFAFCRQRIRESKGKPLSPSTRKWLGFGD